MNPSKTWITGLLQDIYSNNVVGRIIDRIIELVFSSGIKSVLKLRNPKEFKGNEDNITDEQDQQKEIEKTRK